MSHLLTPDGNYVGSYPLAWGTFTRVAIHPLNDPVQ